MKDHIFKQIQLVLMTVAAGGLLGGLSISPVLGQTETDQFNIRSDFDSAIVSLCGGEEVKFSGQTHFKLKTSTTPNGEIRQLVHLNYQNIKGTGVESGDDYIVHEVNNFKVSTNDLAGVFHTVILSKINHLGQELDSMVFIELQTVLDDEGLTKTTVSHVDIRCPDT
jgi:hypothetical protein